MKKILHVYSDKSCMDSHQLCQNTSFDCHSISSEKIQTINKVDLASYDVVIINDEQKANVSIASHIAKLDKKISIFLLCNTHTMSRSLKMLKVTPSVNSNTRCINVDKLKDLDLVIQRGVKQTQQKRALSGFYEGLNKQLKDNVNQAIVKKNIEKSKMIDSKTKKDSLTGLLTRASFLEFLKNSIDEANTNQSGFTLVGIDVDHLRYVNDQHSESIGNMLLKNIAEVILNFTTSKDKAGRIGGDEYGIIIQKKLSLDECNILCEGLRSAIEKIALDIEIKNITTVSIGVVQYDHKDEIGLNDLVRFMYSSLEQVKSQGGGTHYYFDKKLFDRYSYRMEVLKLFPISLERNDFSLSYQPVIDPVRESILYVEALIRWKIGGKEYHPSDFIPVLESENKINRLTEWIIYHALKDMRDIENETSLRFPLSINVSSKSILTDEFIDQLVFFCEKFHISTKSLYLEITETQAMHNVPVFKDQLDKLLKKGVVLVIDDFGDGYAQISRLMQLPVGVLKIDKSFIHGINENPESEKIIEFTIEIGEKLNIPIIAEGVETEGQYAFLRNLGCQYYQGYYFFKPMQVDSILSLKELRRYRTS